MKKAYNKFLNKIGIFSIAFRIAHIVYSHSKMQFRLLKLAAKSGAKIDHTSRIFYDNAEDLIISKNVIVGANSIIFCTNEDNANSFSSQIIIGEGTYIGEMNNIRSGGGKIEIGKKCLISQHVNIIGSNHSTDPIKYIMDQPWDSMKIGVSIGDDVWIGAGATILPGVKIGKGSIVAAGAVVIKDIDPYTIHAGVPARFIKNRK